MQPQLSDFELRRLENMRRNAEMLAKLGIGTIKAELEAPVLAAKAARAAARHVKAMRYAM